MEMLKNDWHIYYIMFDLRTRLVTYIIAWVATGFMRRLRFPSIIIAITLEILIAAVSSAMSREKQEENLEKPHLCAQKVRLY